VPPVWALDNPFPDLPESHPNYEAILSLYDWDVIDGYPDGTFKPDREINRAEFMKILIGDDYKDVDAEKSDCFSDVGTEWYAQYVCAGYSFGWVDGYPDGSFKPEQTVNKVEAIKMVLNAQHLGELALASEISVKPYDDVEVGQWYTPHVVRAKDLGILEETGALLDPGANMTRGGVSEMMYRSEFAVVPAPGFEKDYAAATVTSVVDGDTIWVDLEGEAEKVRLLGIDTPEMSSDDCYAQEATDYLESLVFDEEVILVRDILNDDRDKYDRLLRYVELNGVDINEKMIRDGYALYYDTYDVLRGDDYADAELEAQSEVKGLWGDCDGAGEETDGSGDSDMTVLPSAESDIVINRVFYDGDVPLVESDEYVEIKNTGSESIDLQGYRIDGSKGDEYYVFQSLMLETGGSVRVYTDQGEYSFENNQAIWNNSGETCYLWDNEGGLVDSYSW